MTWCPEIPGLVCIQGRHGRHDTCRARVLAAIQQERRNGGARLQ